MFLHRIHNSWYTRNNIRSWQQEIHKFRYYTSGCLNIMNFRRKNSRSFRLLRKTSNRRSYTVMSSSLPYKNSYRSTYNCRSYRYNLSRTCCCRRTRNKPCRSSYRPCRPRFYTASRRSLWSPCRYTAPHKNICSYQTDKLPRSPNIPNCCIYNRDWYSPTPEYRRRTPSRSRPAAVLPH